MKSGQNPKILEAERHPLFVALGQYLVELREDRKLSPSSVSLYEREILGLFGLLSNPSDLSDLKLSLRKASTATIRRKIGIWKQFLRSCPPPWNQCLDSLPAPKIRQKLPRFLTEEESFRLEAACFRSKFPSRNRLFVAFGLELGLRVSEMLGLRFGDFQGSWLRLIRKGGQEQLLPLTKSLEAQVRLLERDRKAKAEEFVFEGRSFGPMTARAAQKVLVQLCSLAKISPPISPHALRHSFASRLAANGASLVAIKELLGHRSLQTTERYLHVTPEHLRESLNNYLKRSPPTT